MIARLALVALVVLGACTTAKPATHGTTPHGGGGGGGGASAPTGDVQYGLATWYGSEQQGGPTASGERFDKRKLTAAHRTLKLGTRVRVTNQKNGRVVEVRINDRGPYGNAQRIIDVSEAAARVLQMIDAGVVPVKLEIVR